MKILIIEDYKNKLERLIEFVQASCPGSNILQRMSYQSGLKAAINERPELILLDMSLPNYDITSKENGGESLPFGGREILIELTEFGIPSKVIVVTGFETIGHGSEALTLDELKLDLADRFSANYVETVYYHPAQVNWKTELAGALKRALDSK